MIIHHYTSYIIVAWEGLITITSNELHNLTITSKQTYTFGLNGNKRFYDQPTNTSMPNLNLQIIMKVEN